MKPIQKDMKLAIAASSIAIVQGLIWMILCLLGILVYFKALDPSLIDLDHSTYITFNLFAIFYGGEVKLIVILFIYFILSLGWIFISASLIMSIKAKQKKKSTQIFTLWGVWTLLNCFIDLVALGLFVSDYHDVLVIINADPILSRPILMYTLISYGILFSLAARGYVLWIINLAFGIIILRYGMISKKKSTRNENNQVVPYSEERRFDRSGQTNPGFEWETQRPQYNQGAAQGGYPSSASEGYSSSVQGYSSSAPGPYSSSVKGGYAKPAPATPQKPHYNDNVAKLGKQGPKSYAQNIPPPKPPTNYIYPSQQNPMVPNPDYSPPNSPLKSAMKNRAPQNPFTFNRTSNNRY